MRMKATVADIIELREELVPPDLAEDWDNVGLQVGRIDWPVQTIWVALDPSPDVVASACREDVDLLITHHPLMLAALRNIDFSNTRLLERLKKIRKRVKKFNTRPPAQRPELSDAMLGILREYFAGDVHKLSGLLDRDLAHWLDPGSCDIRDPG